MQWPTLQPGGTQQVVGEANFTDALEELAAGRTWAGPRTRWFTARLSREHTNPHDPGAVRVDIGGATVGYLPRDDAPRFHRVVEELAREHVPTTARARLTGGWERGPHGRGSIGVILDVDRRVSRRHADAPFLPGELTVAVHAQPTFRAALERLLHDADSAECTATLVPPPEAGPAALQVRIGDEPVGTVGDTATARHLPLVERVLAAGFPATCAAKIVRHGRGPGVTLRLPRSEDPT
jgi:hypothetical protein